MSLPHSPRRHLELAEVGSTNTVALEAARAGDPGTLWITAERQVAGRGRRERRWVSEPGNLYASLLLIDPAPPAALLNLPLVVALGVRDGLAPLVPASTVAIKWPNDILLDGKKCCGVLIESERLSDGRQAVVIGCGVNVENLPEGTPYPVAGLRSAGSAASVAEVFEAFAGGVEAALALWNRGAGFSAVRARWLAHAAGIGGPCTVNLADGQIAGNFEGLDADGRLLLLETNGARRAISAGDLFLRTGDAGAAPPISRDDRREGAMNPS